MLISKNWLKELIDINLSNDELQETLTMLGLEVEEITDFSEKYDNFFTAEVIACEKHPDADKLSLCEVSLGEGNVINVVCGAPNVAKGQKVVFGKVGAVVPKAGFKLEKRKIRGAVSEGMICSQDELDLGEDSSGIWVLPEDTPIGVPAAEHFGVNDSIIELSVTPNRSDCLSHIGIARELAAKLGLEVRLPEVRVSETGQNINEFCSVEIIDTENCPRYAARVIKGAKIVESPDWIKNRLKAINLRPINIAVDVTNLVLMESGQPLHAFDYDEVAGGKIIVRGSDEGEKFVTLDSKNRNLDKGTLMICDAEKAVAIGGVMGGENSEISDKTTNILIESAYFNPSSIRKTSKKLGLLSDASYRFERGVDPDNLIFALERATSLMVKYAGGEVAQGIIDEYPKKIEADVCKMRFDFANKIIGTKVEPQKAIEILKSLKFEVLESDETSVTVKAPTWRVDIKQEIDLVEEVARFINFNEIEAKFVSELDFSDTLLPKQLSVPPLREKIAQYFVQNGYNEIITQNQIDVKTALLFTDNPVKIANPLGEELSIMKPSVLPSTLKVVKNNLNKGNKDLAIFELGKCYSYSHEKEQTPVSGYKEKEQLVIALSGRREPKQWSSKDTMVDFYDIKGAVESLFESLKIKKYKFAQNTDLSQFTANSINVSIDGKDSGTIGSINKVIKKHFDIEQEVFVAVIELDKIYLANQREGIYRKVSPYPSVERDLAFVCDANLNAGEILAIINSKGGDLLKSAVLFDIYRGENLGEGKKSLAYTLYFSSIEKTLTDSEVDSIINLIVKTVDNKLNATLRKS